MSAYFQTGLKGLPLVPSLARLFQKVFLSEKSISPVLLLKVKRQKGKKVKRAKYESTVKR